MDLEYIGMHVHACMSSQDEFDYKIVASINVREE